MIKEGHTCIQALLLGLGIISYFLIECSNNGNYIISFLSSQVYIYGICFYIFVNIIIAVIFRGYQWKIAFRSCFLGTVCGCGIILCIICSDSYKAFGLYIIVLSLFHFSEYFITAITNPANLSIDSFLLNHSVAYWVAAVASWLEFFLERWLLPSMKQFLYVTIIGMALCIVGEIIRKAAMLTARSNFNHVVQIEKHENHELVTWGVYRFFRHPSYVGWFWWSVGTQILLINPICIVAYTAASWSFFKQRVEFEEMTLIEFFGRQYVAYKKKVGTGLPFINGYSVELVDHND